MLSQVRSSRPCMLHADGILFERIKMGSGREKRISILYTQSADIHKAHKPIVYLLYQNIMRVVKQNIQKASLEGSSRKMVEKVPSTESETEVHKQVTYEGRRRREAGKGRVERDTRCGLSWEH